MFGWLKRDPVQALERKYKAKLDEAHKAGAKYGDRQLEAQLYAEAEEMREALEAMEAERAARD